MGGLFRDSLRTPRLYGMGPRPSPSFRLVVGGVDAPSDCESTASAPARRSPRRGAHRRSGGDDPRRLRFDGSAADRQESGASGGVSGLAELLASFFKVGLCSIGGGYAVIPMIQQEIVERRGWITARVFADIITISQMTPGPLAVNASTFVGVQAAGIAGALTATVGCTVSGVIISALLYSFLIKNRASSLTPELIGPLKAASAGLILSAAATITLSTLVARTASGAASIDRTALLLFAASLLAARRYKINPVMIIAAAGLAGLIIN